LSNLVIENPDLQITEFQNYPITQFNQGFGAARAVRKDLVVCSRGLRGLDSAALSGAAVSKPGRTGNFGCG
jgi:hypothetical protein